MEIRRAAREPTQDRSFDLANVVEAAINEGLSEVGGSFTVIGRRTRSRVLFAHGDFRQVTNIQASQVDTGIGWAEVTGSDVQGRREGVVAHAWCVVTRAASSLEGRNAPSDQASSRYIVVDARNASNGNRQSVEELLAARNGTSRGGAFIVFAVCA